jgi:signal transduction histidine kinase
MLSLLEQFSDYAKASSLQCSTFSFHALLEQVSLAFAATTMHSAVQYTSKIDSSIKQITGDKTKLQEVFWNLLKNAYDASLPDKSIYLNARKCNDYYEISVSDTGCGISSEQIAHIFEPFVTYKSTGTGLGLAICKQIVDAHDGTISVTSTEQVGTSFTISLPIHNLSLL